MHIMHSHVHLQIFNWNCLEEKAFSEGQKTCIKNMFIYFYCCVYIYIYIVYVCAYFLKLYLHDCDYINVYIYIYIWATWVQFLDKVICISHVWRTDLSYNLLIPEGEEMKSYFSQEHYWTGKWFINIFRSNINTLYILIRYYD